MFKINFSVFGNSYYFKLIASQMIKTFVLFSLKKIAYRYLKYFFFLAKYSFYVRKNLIHMYNFHFMT